MKIVLIKKLFRYYVVIEQNNGKLKVLYKSFSFRKALNYRARQIKIYGILFPTTN